MLWLYLEPHQAIDSAESRMFFGGKDCAREIRPVCSLDSLQLIGYSLVFVDVLGWSWRQL